MATREEIIAGLEMTVAQGKRSSGLYAEGEWDDRRASGWTPKEIFSHLAAVAAIVPQLSQGLADAPEGIDIAIGMDINAMNAQSVSSMASMTPEQVMAAFERNYASLIEFVRAMPEERLQMKGRFFSDPIPVSDILATNIALHGLHHVYEASSRLAA